MVKRGRHLLRHDLVGCSVSDSRLLLRCAAGPFVVDAAAGAARALAEGCHSRYAQAT